MGITTRGLAPDDAEVTAALMLRIEADHPTGFCLGAVEIRELMTDKPDSVFEGAFDGEDLVAFTTVLPTPPQAAGQRFILFGDVDPQRLGEGIGTLMLAGSLDRARAIHARAAPGVPATYAGSALQGRDDQADLMTSAGFEAGRHSFLMVADLTRSIPTRDLPPGLRVTPFDPGAAEELRLAHNAAFDGYPDFTSMGADFWALFMVRAAHSRPHLSLVARDEAADVAGYVFAHEYSVPPSGRDVREVHIPYVGTVPAHRGRGLATALLGRVLQLGREAGYVTASLNVDTANPTGALGIYERAGFEQVYRQDFYRLDERPA